MSEETVKKDPNMIEITIKEYNTLRADAGRMTAAESMLNEERGKYEALQSEFETFKATKKFTGPSKEELEAQVRGEFADKLTELERKATEFEGLYRTTVIGDSIMGKLGDRIVPSAQKWIRQDIEKECDLEGDLKSPKIIVKDDQGNVRWSAKKPNEKMDVEEYAEVLESRYPEFFKSSAKGGEQDNRNKGNAPIQSSISFDKVGQMTDQEIRALDPKTLDALINRVQL